VTEKQHSKNRYSSEEEEEEEEVVVPVLAGRTYIVRLTYTALRYLQFELKSYEISGFHSSADKSVPFLGC
jgi:hypothetical protein